MSRVSFSVAMPHSLDAQFRNHLLREDGQEDLCFAVWHPSRGATRTSALISSIILPEPGDRRVHGNASFNAQYFARALAQATSEGGGLAFLHSHPDGRGWQGMSPDDVVAEQGHAASTFGATSLPLIGLTIAGDGAWSARFWPRVAPRTYEREFCGSVRVVGKVMHAHFFDHLAPRPQARATQIRTISSWGAPAQEHMTRLRVAVVGAGSVGGMVAESLARTGFEDITLIDFDTIEEHNLDRLLFATATDIGQLKIDVLAQRLEQSATAASFRCTKVDAAVYEEQGLRAALDCDIIFACVDRPWGRYVLNIIAYAHLIPVYDGGIAVKTNRRGELVRADWRSHMCAPGRACLECLGQYSSGYVQTEREGRLDDPKYIEGLPEGHPLKARENVFAFSMACASQQVLQMISSVIAPMDQPGPRPQLYHFVGSFFEPDQKERCDAGCPYLSFIAKGDHFPYPFIGLRPGADPRAPEAKLGRMQAFWMAIKRFFGGGG